MDFKSMFLPAFVFLCCNIATSHVKAQYFTNDICAGDNYWPLTTVQNSDQLTDLVLSKNGTVKGSGVHDDHGVLSLTGNGYVVFNGFSNDCLMDPGKCTYGFTISFWMRLGGFISHILGFNEKYQKALYNWLAPKIPANSRWVVCYKASRDGWMGTTYRRNCGSKRSTVTIIKVRNYIFGGFLSLPLTQLPSADPSSIKQYIDDKKAFLFSLSNPLGLEPFDLPIKPTMSPMAARVSDVAMMPSFGKGDLEIVDNANTSTQSTSSLGNVYQIPASMATYSQSDLLAGSSPFLVDEIEVFANEATNSSKTYILSSGAESTSSTGFSIYSSSNYLVAKVTANNRTWEVREEPQRVWHHVAIAWSITNGLTLFYNGQSVNSITTGAYNVATSRKTTLLLGKPFTTSVESNIEHIQIHGLTIWREKQNVEKLRQCKNIAFSQLTNDTSSKFTWSVSTCCTPTLNTGPSHNIAGGALQKYYNLSEQSQFADIPLNLKQLDFLTVCWRHRRDEQKIAIGTVFSISDKNGRTMSASMSLHNSILYILLEMPSNRSNRLNACALHDCNIKWFYYCLKFEPNLVHVILDGVPVQSLGTQLISASMKPPFQLRTGNSFSAQTPLHGLFSDFNMWARLLTPQEILKLSRKTYSGGDVVRWTKVTSQFGVSSGLSTFNEWLYVESSYPRIKNDFARAITTDFIPVHINCLQFKSCLKGKDIGRFNVFLINSAQRETLIWSLAGDQINCSQDVYIPVNFSTPSKFVFEGIVGDGYLGDIAFQNVSFMTNTSCDGGNDYIPTRAIDSKIIGHIDNFTNTLQKWLSDAKLDHSYWTACYSLQSSDWISSEELHKQCANKGSSVLLVRYKDYVFGSVFDRSWLAYSQCTSKTTLPSERSFLFSLMSDAGPETVFPIRHSLYSQALKCNDSTRFFPNYGDDLVVDLDSKTVTATYGTTYGSRNGNFHKDKSTLNPSDMEILVSQVRFCPSKCPLGMICDELKGTCGCDELSRLSEVCHTGIFVENFTSNAHDFFTFFSRSDIKNHNRPVWGEVHGSVNVKKGIVKNTISTTRDSFILIASVHSCLTNPSDCPTGVTMSIWLRYFNEPFWKSQEFLFCSDSCFSNSTGFSISRTQSDDDLLNMSVTTTAKKCILTISGNNGIWTHFVIVMNQANEVKIYKNGLLTTPLSETCAQGQYAKNTGKGVVIGKGANVDVDLFTVWGKVLSFKTIESLHNLYKGRKNMTLHIDQLTGAYSKYMDDKESIQYQSQCSNYRKKVNLQGTVKPIDIGCSIRTRAAENKAFVVLSVIYTDSNYDVAKPVIDEFKKSGATFKLDTVYMKSCAITKYEVVGPSVSLEWDTCGTEPAYGLLYAYQITVSETTTKKTTFFNVTSACLKTKIPDLKENTQYIFSVKALTFEGIGGSTLQEIIKTKDRTLTERPENVQATPVNYSTIAVQWTGIPFSEAYGRVLGYHVNVTKNNVTVKFMNISEPAAIISGLNHLTEYGVEVRGYAFRGHGPWSLQKTIATPEGVPSSAPANIDAKPLSSTSFAISWNTIDPAHTHGTVHGYYLLAKSERNSDVITLLTCNTSAVFKNLLPFTDYSVGIAGFTKAGLGVNGQFYVSNQEKVPALPPTRVSTTGQISRTTMNITWQTVPSAASFSPITGYAVMLLKEPKTSKNITVVVNDSSIMYRYIDGLTPYTKYDVRVAGINRIGVGVFSSQFIVRTAEDVPRVTVSNASSANVTKTGTVVQWSPVRASDINGVFHGYIVIIYDSLRDVNSTRFLCAGKSNLSLTDLHPYTSYSIYMAPFTGAGFGEKVKAAEFRTQESAPDAPPQNVTSHNTSSTGLEITWQSPPITNINGKLRGYLVVWFETLAADPVIFNKTLSVLKTNKRRKRRNVDSTSSQTFQIKGLKKFTMYTLRIQAFTVENGVFFETNATTAEDVPSLPPPNITVHNSSSTSIVVAWQPIPDAFHHGNILGYQVFYQQSDKPSGTPMVETIGKSALTVTLTNLSKYTTYDVSVAGFTSPGTGNVSKIFKVTTDQDVPGEAPPLLNSNTLSTTEVFLSWRPIPPEKRYGIIIGFRLSITHVNGDPVKSLVVRNGSALGTLAKELIAWTNYTVSITGITIKGEGPWSPKLLIMTLEEVPLPPTNLKTATINSTSIKVKWDASNTTFLRGILRKYRVIFTSKGSVFPIIRRNVTVPASKLSVVLNNLYKFTKYDIKMTALTIADGNKSESIAGETDSDIPSAGPSRLRLLEATGYHLTITWDTVPPQHRNGIITNYKINVLKTETSSPVKEKTYEPATTLTAIEDLRPFTTYTFIASAKTDKGWGASSEITVQTAETAPDGKPQGPFTSSHIAVDMIYVKWSPVPEALANGVVLGYHITYQLVSLGEESVEDAPKMRLTVTATEVTLKKLQIYGKYKIQISAFTEKGAGPHFEVHGETCRCHRTLHANWREYQPYVNMSVATGAPGGILPEVIKTMTEQCCGQCGIYNKSIVNFFTNPDGSSAIKLSEDELKGNISDEIDFTFPIYGTVDQKTYHGGYGYRALIESPGIVLVLNKDFEFEYDNPNGPSRTTMKSVVLTLMYIVLNLSIAYITGFLLWLLERNENPEFFPVSFIKGTWEGFWWALVTMSTIGYGDRFAKTPMGRILTIAWMLMGIVLYGMLLSFLSSMLTATTISQYGGGGTVKKLAAIHNSPEHRLGQRLSIPINEDVEPKSFQELYEALIKRKVFGALVDGYAVGSQKHLFEHPSLTFLKIYDVKPAYGIVLAGTSSRLRQCFYSYIQSRRAEIIRRVAENAKFIEIEENPSPVMVQFTTNFFKPGTPLFDITINLLYANLGVLVFLGCIYEMVRRCKTPPTSPKNLGHEDFESLRRNIQRFYDNMTRLHHSLRHKHKEQMKDYFKSKKN